MYSRPDGLMQKNMIKRSPSSPPVHQQHDELVKFIQESWNKVSGFFGCLFLDIYSDLIVYSNHLLLSYGIF